MENNANFNPDDPTTFNAEQRKKYVESMGRSWIHNTDEKNAHNRSLLTLDEQHYLKFYYDSLHQPDEEEINAQRLHKEKEERDIYVFQLAAVWDKMPEAQRDEVTRNANLTEDELGMIECLQPKSFWVRNLGIIVVSVLSLVLVLIAIPTIFFISKAGFYAFLLVLTMLVAAYVIRTQGISGLPIFFKPAFVFSGVAVLMVLSVIIHPALLGTGLIQARSDVKNVRVDVLGMINIPDHVRSERTPSAIRTVVRARLTNPSDDWTHDMSQMRCDIVHHRLGGPEFSTVLLNMVSSEYSERTNNRATWLNGGQTRIVHFIPSSNLFGETNRLSNCKMKSRGGFILFWWGKSRT